MNVTPACPRLTVAGVTLFDDCRLRHDCRLSPLELLWLYRGRRQGLLIVKKSSACMPVDWQSSPQHDACLSMPVVAGEKRGDYPPVDCDCHVIYSEKTERGTQLPACDCLLILTVSRLPAYDCSHRREMRRLPACRLRLSRRLASPGHNNIQARTQLL